MTNEQASIESVYDLLKAFRAGAPKVLSTPHKDAAALQGIYLAIYATGLANHLGLRQLVAQVAAKRKYGLEAALSMSLRDFAVALGINEQVRLRKKGRPTTRERDVEWHRFVTEEGVSVDDLARQHQRTSDTVRKAIKRGAKEHGKAT